MRVRDDEGKVCRAFFDDAISMFAEYSILVRAIPRHHWERSDRTEAVENDER